MSDAITGLIAGCMALLIIIYGISISALQKAAKETKKAVARLQNEIVQGNGHSKSNKLRIQRTKPRYDSECRCIEPPAQTPFN